MPRPAAHWRAMALHKATVTLQKSAPRYQTVHVSNTACTLIPLLFVHPKQAGKFLKHFRIHLGVICEETLLMNRKPC